MTATRTAADRERLLVPVPWTGPAWGSPEEGVAPRPTAYSPPDLQPVPASPEYEAATSGAGERLDERSAPTVDPALAHPVLFQARCALIMVGILAVGLVLQLAWVGNWLHRSSQVNLFNQFRTELALGTGPTGAKKPSLPIGKPMALIEIPSIGVKQVVVEGTTGAALTDGPGHLRSTVFPGGVGNSVIFGRDASYGGPFGRIVQLSRGARITVVTQVGTSHFRVLGVRFPGGDPFRVPATASVLTLETATGPKYAPTGVVSVFARNVGTPLNAQRPPVHVVPASQRPLGVDTSGLTALLLWLVALAVVVAGAVWTWHRRGHLQAWIVFSAPLALLWFFVADQVTRVLPNLL